MKVPKKIEPDKIRSSIVQVFFTSDSPFDLLIGYFHKELRWLQKIAADFDAEKREKEKIVAAINSDILNDVFIQSVAAILKFAPDTIGVELTNDKSLFFIAKFGDITAHIEIFIMGENEPTFLTVCNLYNGQEPILADSGSFESAIAQLEEFIPAPTRHAPAPYRA